MEKIRIVKKQAIDGILFLPGVFKKDCKIEDFFVNKLLINNAFEQSKYNKLVVTFTNIENYPTSTNLLCWSCTRSFKTRPYFEPQQISQTVASKTTISAKGNFCSPNCVIRYIQVYTKDMSERKNKIEMLKIVCELFTGKKPLEIMAAPPHTDMVQYGGNLSLYEYQKELEKLDIDLMHKKEENAMNSIIDNNFIMKLLDD